ncbi:sensor histidine kinase [Undibacterium sp.]|uniref:sensor histidine kinase n=1 Tax=Undibacterium sp. TaxID=1914977 RepID=UPI00374D2B0E
MVFLLISLLPLFCCIFYLLCGGRWRKLPCVRLLFFRERQFERHRIARILHDNFLQQVQSLNLVLQTVIDRHGLPALDKLALGRLVDEAEEAMNHGRELIFCLRRAGNAEATLEVRLRELGFSLCRGTSIQFLCFFDTNIGRRADAYSDEIFMIVSEAIRNAIRHSGATIIRVSDENTLRGIRLLVSDNGKGISNVTLRASHNAGHYGLLGMIERADMLGAALSIEHGPDAETIVVLQLAKRFIVAA